MIPEMKLTSKGAALLAKVPAEMCIRDSNWAAQKGLLASTPSSQARKP